MTGASIRLSVATGIAVGVLASVVSAALASPPGPEGSGAALETCAKAQSVAAEYGPIQGVVRGERSTASEVASWQEGRHVDFVSGLVSPLRSVQGDTPITVCLFRGEFATPTGPPSPDGTPNPSHDVLTLLATDEGQIIFDSAGYEDRIPAATPSLWRQEHS